MACMHVFLGEVSVLWTERLHWDAHKIKGQIVVALLCWRYCCAGRYPFTMCSSDCGPSDLVVDVAEPTLVAGPALAAVRHNLALCVHLTFEEVAPDVSGPRLQVRELIDGVCLAASYLSLSRAATECLCNWSFWSCIPTDRVMQRVTPEPS